jgi:hypothetical protein
MPPWIFAWNVIIGYVQIYMSHMREGNAKKKTAVKAVFDIVAMHFTYE